MKALGRTAMARYAVSILALGALTGLGAYESFASAGGKYTASRIWTGAVRLSK